MIFPSIDLFAISNLIAGFYDKYIRVYDQRYFFKTLSELYILFIISVPLSLLLFLMFNRYKHKVLVDLGHHKWLVK